MVYNLLTYLPGYGYYPPQTVQEYTPVVINFKAAMLNANGDAVYGTVKKAIKPQYFLKISPPRITRKGTDQHMSDPIIVPIDSDGMFRYQLAPSNSYYPFGRYVVEYYKRRNSIPFDIQEWTVPALPKTQAYTFNYDEAIEDYQMPLNLWSAISLSPAAEYVVNYNILRFVGTTDFRSRDALRLVYQPAATLDQLLQYDINDLNQNTRIRY